MFALRVMRGGSELGVLTLTRFYSIHTMLLPAAIGGLILAHLYLVVRHGVTVPPHIWERFRRPGDRTEIASGGADRVQGAVRVFKPRASTTGRTSWWRTSSSPASCSLGVFGFMLALGVPTEAPADPTNTAYVPPPEWYFMFLFQMLKYFPGDLEWLAAGVIPPLALLLLFLLPLFDRSPWRSPSRRPVAMVLGLVALIILAYLTWAAYASSAP